MMQADNRRHMATGPAIQLANQPILDGFEHALRQSGLSEQTIKAHVDNIRFFARYLLLYSYSLHDSMRPPRGMSMTF